MNTTVGSTEKPWVLFVPGGIMPSELAYGPLLAVVGSEIRPLVKDLEVYATDVPPPDYGLQLEAHGIGRAADAAGAQRFHLVGYSAGGASSLAFVAQHPERVRSLALIEPAWIGTIAPEDEEHWSELHRLAALDPDQRMSAFMRWQMRPGAEPPRLPLPAGPAPAWMAKRPGGINAFTRAFDAYKLDQSRFRLFKGPVYMALGSLSTPYYEHSAKTLSGLFPDMRVEVYEGRSHLDPPHRTEAERFGNALRELWGRAD